MYTASYLKMILMNEQAKVDANAHFFHTLLQPHRHFLMTFIEFLMAILRIPVVAAC